MSLSIDPNQLSNPYERVIDKLNKKISDADIEKDIMHKEIEELKSLNAQMQEKLGKKSITDDHVIKNLVLEKQKMRNQVTITVKKDDKLEYDKAQLELENFSLKEKYKEATRKNKEYEDNCKTYQEIIKEKDDIIEEKDDIIKEDKEKLKRQNETIIERNKELKEEKQKIRIIKKSPKRTPCDYFNEFYNDIEPFFKALFSFKWCTPVSMEQGVEAVHEPRPQSKITKKNR